MPTYEYRCPEGHTFEQFQRMSDPPKADCPTCGKGAERLISAGGGFLFKGDGFYITDYRSDSYKAQAKKDSAGSSDAGAASSTGAASSASAD
jgi:putative FmdB family regulatory protein